MGAGYLMVLLTNSSRHIPQLILIHPVPVMHLMVHSLHDLPVEKILPAQFITPVYLQHWL
ncbi:Uncharacterised protein [Citrobacter freundii]|nr:Uncharacterised protein [Citrobacter freundii]